ncbi:hypothetical protein BCR42DRAFT_424011 [Absidia repens]|uniref:BHLH domain-containing protein n=1 Tax=Absidia repens TaxID=90262 RepID=A0A1X2I4L7_9FUNG|nr:hypothetical protein BCR42DRAFT_424011 [Absidia repens]
MNLADFQLDMDMLQTMTSQQQQHIQSQQAQAMNDFERMDMFFQGSHPQKTQFMNMATSKATTDISTPLYHVTQPNEYFDQSDVLTPLISPAITPSFSYTQKIHNGTIGSDVDFSPLSSPAMVPQQDQEYEGYRHQNSQHLQAQHQQSQYHQLHQLQRDYQTVQDNLSPSSGDNHQLSPDQMCEQYEQLENAKRMITRRLSELQNGQPFQDNYGGKLIRNISTRQSDNLLNYSSHDSGEGLARQAAQLEPVTPASLMNMRQRQKSKVSFSQLPETAKATINQVDVTDGLSSNQNSPILDINGYSGSPPTSSLTNAANGRGKRKTKQNADSKPTQKRRRSSNRGEKQHGPTFNNNPHGSLPHKHVSPRALKPLLVSPSLAPDQHPPSYPRLNSSRSGQKQLQPLTTHQKQPQDGLPNVDDAEHILATRSNYQNLMEGKAAALGIAFTSQIKSGLEVRRTAHKAAEQKRRDSLKEWFDRLRHEVEEGYVKKKSGLTTKVIREQQREKRDGRPEQLEQQHQKRVDDDDGDGGGDDDEDIGALKPLSKVLLLRYAYEYIAHLKDTLTERDDIISRLTSHGAKQQDGIVDEDEDENMDDNSNYEGATTNNAQDSDL